MNKNILNYFFYFIYFNFKIKKRRNYEYYNKLPPEEYEKELKIWFKKKMKYDLDLENPKNFNEKIQW